MNHDTEGPAKWTTSNKLNTQVELHCRWLRNPRGRRLEAAPFHRASSAGKAPRCSRLGPDEGDVSKPGWKLPRMTRRTARTASGQRWIFAKKRFPEFFPPGDTLWPGLLSRGTLSVPISRSSACRHSGSAAQRLSGSLVAELKGPEHITASRKGNG